MTWAPISLQNPISNAAGLGGALGCEVFSPWTPGISEGRGLNRWLSFAEAVEAAVARVEATTPQALFAFGLPASSPQGLADIAGALSAALPMPALDKVKRVAAAVGTLAEQRLQLPEPTIAGKTIDLTALPFARDRVLKDLAQQAKQAAADLAALDPLAELNGFETEKLVADALVDAALPNLSGGAGWFVYATTDFATALRSGLPQAEASHSMVMTLTGTPAQLGFFNEMMA